MGRFKGKTVRKKNQDKPRKTSFLKTTGLKKERPAKIIETLPEDTDEVIFLPVQKVQPQLAQQTEVEPKDASPPSLIIDTAYISDSSLLDSSSPPSPEVFRQECYVEQCTFHLDDELEHPYCCIKNSTLQEGSQSETILTYHPPNLSSIIDASADRAEDGKQDIDQGEGTKKASSDGCDLVPGPNSSDQECKTSSVLIRKDFKKRVRFRSPLSSEKNGAEYVAAPKRKIQYRKIIPKSATPSCSLLKKPKTAQAVYGAKFFDFPSDSELDSYLQEMRERCTKLLNAPPFPLATVTSKE